MLIASFFTFADKASRILPRPQSCIFDRPPLLIIGGGGGGEGGIDASTDNFSPIDKLET